MRTHHCAEVGEKDIQTRVTLCGWVDVARDHGGIIFIDLRDHTGIVQAVLDPGMEDAEKVISDLRLESVARIEGEVRARPEGTENPGLKTGKVEVEVSKLDVLSRARPLPYQLDDANVSEEIRLKNRHLDLRKPESQERLRVRSRFVGAVRNFLGDEGFVDIETPMLTRSTPEGARDFLVPSRHLPGSLYALPQSPQLFKQSLMGAGFDRYYQIAKCFRDEAFRSDRQAEFTQIDVEMAFVEPEDVISLAERMVVAAFREANGTVLEQPFPRITHGEAMSLYGTDRPDLRNPLKFDDLTEMMRDVEFKVFREPANDPAGRVAALRLPGGARLTRQEINSLTELAIANDAKGLAYIKVTRADPPELQSPIVKFLGDEVAASLLGRLGCADGDMIFFGAGAADVVNKSMAAIRDRVGGDFGLLADGWAPVWVTDFPLFDYDKVGKRWNPSHHPFTSPVDEHLGLLGPPDKAGGILSKAYDLVLNGTEIGGGSIRIHDRDTQLKALQVLGFGREEAEERFGFLLNVLSHGMPPHGGIAMGVDRMVQIITGAASIRDVIAFPKTQRGQCLFTDAPAPVDADQLKELGLRKQPEA